MGWSMEAIGPRGGRIRNHDEFRAACKVVGRIADGVDGILAAGAIHLSACANAFSDMTNQSPYQEHWSQKDIAEIFAAAAIPPDRATDMHYLCVWHFLRVCTELGLGARASW